MMSEAPKSEKVKLAPPNAMQFQRKQDVNENDEDEYEEEDHKTREDQGDDEENQLNALKPGKRIVIRGLSREERKELRRKQNRESARRTRERYRIQKRSSEKNFKAVVAKIKELEEQIKELCSSSQSCYERVAASGKVENVKGAQWMGAQLRKLSKVEKNGSSKADDEDDDDDDDDDDNDNDNDMGIKNGDGKEEKRNVGCSVISVHNLINHQSSDGSSCEHTVTNGDSGKRKRLSCRRLSPEEKREVRRQQNRESARRLRERARIRKEELEREYQQNMSKVNHLQHLLCELRQQTQST